MLLGLGPKATPPPSGAVYLARVELFNLAGHASRPQLESVDIIDSHARPTAEGSWQASLWRGRLTRSDSIAARGQ